jgi:hypothetical protein
MDARVIVGDISFAQLAVVRNIPVTMQTRRPYLVLAVKLQIFFRLHLLIAVFRRRFNPLCNIG